MSALTTRRQLTPEIAQDHLEALCARAEHSTAEVRKKLRQWGISIQDSEMIIKRLVNSRYVDDSRYTRALVNDKVKFARWGRFKINHALYAKGINPQLIAQALDTIDPDIYEANLHAVLTAKARTLPRPLSYEDRVKLYRHAISRGYESELISRAIKTLDRHR